jgi:hypothetical protein
MLTQAKIIVDMKLLLPLQPKENIPFCGRGCISGGPCPADKEDGWRFQ